MPLSEHEQRLLDQIERALYAEDPKFASTVRSTDLKSHLRRRVKRGIALVVVGLVGLVAGAATSQLAVGVVGFLVALAGGLLIMRSVSGRSASPAPDIPRLDAKRRGAKRHRRGGGATGGWRERLDERIRRRWDDRGE